MNRNKTSLTESPVYWKQSNAEKFPTTMNINDKIILVHSAMPSVFEGTILDEPVVLSDIVSISCSAVQFIFQLPLNYSKCRLNFSS